MYICANNKRVSYKQLLASTNSVRFIFYKVFPLLFKIVHYIPVLYSISVFKKDNKGDLIEILALNPLTDKPVVHIETLSE